MTLVCALPPCVGNTPAPGAFAFLDTFQTTFRQLPVAACSPIGCNLVLQSTEDRDAVLLRMPFNDAILVFRL